MTTDKLTTLTEAIEKQSRLLADIESIDPADIVIGDDGYQAVPDEFIGQRRLDIGMKYRVRRWWNWPEVLKIKKK